MKASDVIEGWDKALRCTGVLRQELVDGTIKVCALGALGEAGGIDWGEPLPGSHLYGREVVREWNTVKLYERIKTLWHLTPAQVRAIQSLSDFEGFDAVVSYLKRIER